MTTATVVTEVTVTEWTDGISQVLMYRGILGWTVETRILGDVFTSIHASETAARFAYAAEVAALGAPVTVDDGDDYEPLTWDC